MFKNILKNKLLNLGYDSDLIEEKIDCFDFDILDKTYQDEESINTNLELVEFTGPTIEIARNFLDVKGILIQKVAIDGNMTSNSISVSTGNKISIVDYDLSQKICIVTLDINLKMQILFYNPDKDTVIKYRNQTYEEVYKDDRNSIANDYFEALTDGGRVSISKAREILQVILSEYVIDEIAIDNLNPRLKLYDVPEKYADNITEYELKYINTTKNKIETARKEIFVRLLGRDVNSAKVINDPYVRTENLNICANFPMNRVSFFWLFSNEMGKEEIGIYTAIKKYDEDTYEDYYRNSNTKIDKISFDLARKFSYDIGYEITDQYIKEVLKKLNPELVVPSMNILEKYQEQNGDAIEPLKYKYRAISDPAEFESRLYVSIEDNAGRRYKYKISENVSNDLTTIGNKLDYTDKDGRKVQKQSVADFDITSTSTIVRMETFIDIASIDQLLGYIYEDVESSGTSLLPMPSVEVDFYFPDSTNLGNQIKMYNGTSFDDISSVSIHNTFYTSGTTNNDYSDGKNKNKPGTVSVTVRYVNSAGEVLKENTINNVIPDTTFVPDTIPIISDKEGKEWVYDTSQIPGISVSDTIENVTEMRYIPKMTTVVVSYISKQGKKIREPIKKDIQCGTTYDATGEETCTDNEDTEWYYQYSMPKKLTITDNETKNRITLVYDIVKADVVIKYINKNGEELLPSSKISAPIKKKYSANVEEVITDSEGKKWQYVNDKASTIIVDEEKPNIIVLVYDVLKVKVTVSFVNEKNEKIIDDYVEFLQAGIEFVPKYEEIVFDYGDKKWLFEKISHEKIVASINVEENIIKVMYKMALAKVSIRIVNENNQKIKDDYVEMVQVGSVYTSKNIGEVVDINNLVWIPDNSNKEIIVKEAEVENKITISYKKALSKVVVKFFDDERNELIPEKIESLQVGSTYTPEILSEIEGQDGRKWLADKEKIPTITVKRFEEENIISFYYNKKMTKITLNFTNAQGKGLHATETVDAQIGSEYKAAHYFRITDYENVRWMLESTEPKKIIVKESDNNFNLIYGEVKAVVIVRYIDNTTSNKIEEDYMAKERLGAIFAPNIRMKIIDKNKRQWKYVGEKDVSIVAKENEQENLIELKYEADKAKVIVRYQSVNDNLLRDDIVQNVQIGTEIKITEKPKIVSKDGLMWQLNNISNNVIRVSEKEEENIIVSKYDPLYANVKINYISEKKEELSKSTISEVQVGKKFNATETEKVTDKNGLMWAFAYNDSPEITVLEDENIVDLYYKPLNSLVRVEFISEDGENIKDDLQIERQVGSNFETEKENRVIDNVGLYWKFKSIVNPSLIVKEGEDANISTIIYEKEMSNVTLKYEAIESKEIKDSNVIKVQIGEHFKPEIIETIIDNDGMGWIIDKNNPETYLVQENPDNNIFSIKYNKKMAKIYEGYYDEENGDELCDPTILEKQIGEKHVAKLIQEVTDREGKEWITITKNEVKIFATTSKIEAIRVDEDESKNVVKFKYKKSLINVTIKYQDTLGNQIKKDLIVQAQIGSNYTADVINRIIDGKGSKWTYNPKSNNTIKVSKDEKANVVILAYEEEKATIMFKFQDEFNNRLRAPEKLLEQIGTVYTPTFDNIVTDEEGKVWEYKERSLENITVSEDEKQNIFTLIYKPMNTDVIIHFVNLSDKPIIEDSIVKAQLGSKFTPNIDKTIIDSNSLLYKIKEITPQEVIVKQKTIEKNENLNVFKLKYEPVYSTVTIKYQDIDGKELKEDEVVQLQVGSEYKLEPIQFIKDKKENQWGLINNEKVQIRVLENAKENIIKQVYEIAKTDVIVRYKDVDGNILREDEHFSEQIGNDFIPKTIKVLVDSKNRKWNFFNSDPIKLRVGSINNVITLMYEEAKASVTIKYQDENGRTLKADEKALVQIGSRFFPKISNKIIYDANDIWRFVRFEPDEIIVSENEKENIIIQLYKADAVIVKENKEQEEIVEEKKEEQSVKEEKTETKQTEEIEEKPEAHSDAKVEKDSTSEFEFKDPDLLRLSKNINMTTNEKIAINKLNDYNAQTISLLHELIDNYNEKKQDEIYDIIQKEKTIIQENLNDIIAEDKTGNKLLKIFEAITASEIEDKSFYVLQQRKAIALADYYVEKEVSESDQIFYICEHGKTQQEIKLINEKISKASGETAIKYKETRAILFYEKVILDNYYKARSLVRDNFFDNDESKNALPPTTATMVSNMLVKQTYNLLLKSNLTMIQKNELEALISLLNQTQIGILNGMINKISDGRQRKETQKILKELLM